VAEAAAQQLEQEPALGGDLCGDDCNGSFVGYPFLFQGSATGSAFAAD
jgi:hypothetical protein